MSSALPSSQYQLHYAAQSWRDALFGVAQHLPNHVHPDNIQVIQQLPIFAVVVVINNQTLNAQPNVNIDELMRAWATSESGWILRTVSTQAEHVRFFAHKEVTPITDVSVFRYLLIPSQKTQITPEKRDAAAHIIDDQISTYLRRKLKPVNTHAISTDQDGITPIVGKKIHDIDCHIMSVAQMLRRHKLACFDMDSTLIRQEVINELAKFAGVGEQVDKITEQAMRGEIDFNTSFAARLQLLKGLDADIIDKIKPLLIPHAGAFSAIAALKALGYRTALISGGFMPFAKHIAELLGIDNYYANNLDIADGKLTGDVTSVIIDGKQKARIVAKIADSMSITLDEVICIGDGANDLSMMAISDVGIAFHAKPIVQVKADVAINATGLEGVLYTLGYPALKPIAQ